MEDTEKQWDVHHQDDLLWGKGITDMVTNAVPATEYVQNEEKNADTYGEGLEASIHPDLTWTGGPEEPEERQHLQPGKRLKSLAKPNPPPAPRPMPTPTTTATSAPKWVITSALTTSR